MRFLFINNGECFTLQFGFLFKEKKSLRKFQERFILLVPIFLMYIAISPGFSSFLGGRGDMILCLCGCTEDGRKGNRSSLETK